MDKRIPFPNYQSWMHERCKLPKLTFKDLQKFWNDEGNPSERRFNYITSKILTTLGLTHPRMIHVSYKILRNYFKLQFKILNRLKIYGKENIPKEGGIFIVNHPGQYDPMILMTALPYEIGALTHWNYSWFTDMAEKVYGFITQRPDNDRQNVVERMTRQILLKNRNFAIWPEGHPNGTGMVEQGFSSIARVYATINCKEDKIPFVPVLIRGGGIYQPGFHFGPIDIHILKPVFAPREWLRNPKEDEQGKTPRELIDWAMLFIAKAQKQSQLAPNLRLEGNKLRYTFKGKHKEHQVRHFHLLRNMDLWKRRKSMNNIYNIKWEWRNKVIFKQEVEHNTLNQYINSENLVGNLNYSNEFRDSYRQMYHFRCSCSKKEGRLLVDWQKLVFENEVPHDIFLTHCDNCNKEYIFAYDISSFFFKERKKHKFHKNKTHTKINS